MSVDVVVNEDDLAEMVDQVWVSYLDPEGLNPLVPTGDRWPAIARCALVGVDHRLLDGHVVYAARPQAARQAAAAFLAMEPDEVSPEDVSDVLGELANIVGGNVKAMLPPGCFLSAAAGRAGARVGDPVPERRADQRPVRHLGGRAGVRSRMWQSRDDRARR